MDRKSVTDMLAQKAKSFHMTGSRYICDPAPTDTDEDYIALDATGALQSELRCRGFVQNTDPGMYAGMPDFLAFRGGDFNVVITFSQSFFDRFVAATELARVRNLTVKADRISLFQSILYGNS